MSPHQSSLQNHPIKSKNTRKTAIYKASDVRYALYEFANIHPFLGVKVGGEEINP